MTSTVNNIPGLCIPFTHRSVTKSKVIAAIEHHFGAGAISRVDEKTCRSPQDQSYFKRFFIHFKSSDVPLTESINELVSKLNSGEQLKIVYDEPWYFKCSAMYEVSDKHTKKFVAPSPLPKPRSKMVGRGR